MKESKKEYWKGLEELNPTPEFLEDAKNEFPSTLADVMEEEGTTRRDFLKTLGFGMAAVSLAACEAPVRKAIPYLNKPETIDPGVPNYYASTYMQGGDYASVVIKTREGRPIKVEGNKLSSLSQGGTNARVQASVLSLYDENRLQKAYKEGKEAKWNAVDKEIISGLQGASKIAIVSNTVLSPTTKQVIKDFQAKYPGSEHVTYDAVSYSAMLDANKEMYGTRALPSHNFEKADVIVSFGADFLGTWISDIEYAKQYSKGKKVSNKNMKMSRHYQFETIMSMTGANADYRTPIKPSEQGKAVAALYNAIAGKMGGEKISGVKGNFENLDKAAKDLMAAKGKSLVVVDSSSKEVNMIVNKINEMLGNYGKTINMDKPSFQRQGDDSAMKSLVAGVKSGSVDAVIFLACNPVYNSAQGADLGAALNGKLAISTSSMMDETASVCKYVCPETHYLENWDDAEPKAGMFSLGQPTISKLFENRQGAQSLMTWSGQAGEYVDKVKENWKSYVMPLAGGASFEAFWNKALHDGVVEVNASYSSIHGAQGAAAPVMDAVAEGEVAEVEGEEMVEEAAVASSGFTVSAVAAAVNAKSADIEFIKYQKVAIGDGAQLNNPWLHECPDPVTKACWGDYVSMSKATAFAKGLMQDDLITVFEGNKDVKLPVMIQPGQADNTVAIAYGYGRKGGKCIDTLNGANMFTVGNPTVALGKKEGTYQIAQTQTHSTYFGRESVIQESTLDQYKDLEQFNKDKFTPLVTGPDGVAKAPKEFDLYDKYEYENHHWKLVVDMNSCTGCSACVVACVAENNIPTVGRQEVINRRDMHWMRIDRYYTMDQKFMDNDKSFGMNDDEERIKAVAANPEVVFQPMMCQHCNHASCENVCPVAATTHSTEGLNMMAYNRCIGTRYCANNCAYKVRRFNWFNYADNDDAARRKGFSETNPTLTDLGRMVLNPDVVVRFRGVMEKCTMCVQRIQYGKLEAKKAGKRPEDGDIVVACQQACPSDALTFGDFNDPESAVSKMIRDEQKERAYVVLEEVNTQPNVHYLTKIRNREVLNEEAAKA